MTQSACPVAPNGNIMPSLQNKIVVIIKCYPLQSTPHHLRSTLCRNICWKSPLPRRCWLHRVPRCDAKPLQMNHFHPPAYSSAHHTRNPKTALHNIPGLYLVHPLRTLICHVHQAVSSKAAPIRVIELGHRNWLPWGRGVGGTGIGAAPSGARDRQCIEDVVTNVLNVQEKGTNKELQHCILEIDALLTFHCTPVHDEVVQAPALEPLRRSHGLRQLSMVLVRVHQVLQCCL
mmetsp:Transcript_91966/g.154258  ORF Transcript_91966/g.154258 Transcript_91966/m.154258 type:complete len:232 (-) Transcript_91966:986-1681(-)